MKELPGRLTERHLKLAEERGDNYIFYKGINYSLKELYDGAGISRTKQKPKVSENLRGHKLDNSNGIEPKQGSNERKE